MTGEKYTVGVDFGTLSGRALVVRVDDGHEIASAEHPYEHGVLTEALPGGGVRLPNQWALQVPADYVDVLRTAVPQAVAKAGIDPADVIGVGTDFTACTMVPVRSDGTPLCELEQFANRPHAYAKLWRHHSPQPQADRINAVAAQRGEWWLPRYGGLISSEWEFAKALEMLQEDPRVYEAIDRWVEGADWIVWQLSGTYVPTPTCIDTCPRSAASCTPTPPMPPRGPPVVSRYRAYSP
jgi:L-ribulokinase